MKYLYCTTLPMTRGLVRLGRALSLDTAMVIMAMGGTSILCLADTDPSSTPAQPLVVPKAVSFPPARVHLLDGPLKQSRDAAEKHLLSLDVDRLLAPYRAEAGLPEKAARYTGWETGSLPGVGLAFYLSGISNLTEANGNKELVRRLGYILDELAACQEATGGYLLGCKNGRAIFARVEKEGRFEGFSPWDGTGQATPYYSLEKTFSGLRDAYRIGRQPKALQIAIKLGNWLDEHLSHVTDAQLQKLMSAEYGGMNWVLADLYADSGDARFLALSRRWVNHGIMDPLEQGHDVLGGRHANASIPQFSGLAARYPFSGVSSDRATAEFFWESVVKHHSYVNGGNSESEHFCAADKLNDTLTPFTAENCNSYNMLRLTQLLFNIQPSAAYADYMERVLFNHILAAQDTDNGGVCYFLPLMTGTRKRVESEEVFSCCVCSGFDSYARTASYIYSHDAENLFVNLAVASEVTWPEKKLVLKQETRFPDEDTAVFRVALPQATRFVLNVRYPHWATAGVTIQLNGQPYTVSATPGSFIPISREWRNDDTVTVTTPLKIRSEPMPDNPNRVAIFAGPVLLAGVLGPVADPLVEQPGYAPVIMAGDKPLDQWLKATSTPLIYTTQVGRPREVELHPFYKLRQQTHCIYWDCVTPAQWQTHTAEVERLTAASKDLDQRTMDRVVVGNRDSENAHAAAVADTSIGIGNNNGAYLGHLTWRHSNKPAGLGYTLKVAEGAPLSLYCRYMGRATYETQRDFSIEVDGVVIAKINMPMDNSVTAGLIEAHYNIPEELVRGKQSIKIFMKPDTKKTTGKLVEMRIVK